MIALAKELLECDVVAADTRRPSNLCKALAILRGRAKDCSGSEECLLICPGPPDLQLILNIDNWRRRFRFLSAWIIDSFWVDHVTMYSRLACPFDQLFVTTIEDVDSWKAITGVPTAWLPWGTDALRLGCGATEREWDVTRVGRQPPEWDDDDGNAVAARLHAIKYRGRPNGDGLSDLQNQELMMDVYARSKYLLAFSNGAHFQHYTHPTREYLTGRWVDALACGAVVAGVAPRGPSADQLLWRGATLELGTIRREEGLRVLADALQAWKPESAAANHLMALRQLDWRWRLQALAAAHRLNSAPLSSDIARLEQRIANLAATVATAAS